MKLIADFSIEMRGGGAFIAHSCRSRVRLPGSWVKGISPRGRTPLP
jgi:hypothetical protein